MAEALWRWSELVAAAAGLADGSPPANVINGITIDSRAVSPGDLFVALIDKRDGHDFVANAFAAGAAAALVNMAYERKPADGALIRVEHTLGGLQRIGIAARARLDDNPNARVIAITGSAGKTTTKEMLKSALSRLGPTHAADKSFNNHWGVPLTLARMPRETLYGVFEIGMNHPGEIAPLSIMVRPHAAIVLNVLEAHLGQFASTEKIAEEKAQIFTGLDRNSGTAIFYADSAHAEVLRRHAEARAAKILTFGSGHDNDAYTAGRSGFDEDPLNPQETGVRFKEDNLLVQCRLPAPGRHIAMNAIAAMLTIRSIGGDVVEAARGFEALDAPEGRGARIVFKILGGHFLFIDESYNANPGSMTAAIETARQAVQDNFTRLVLVLGDMLELGEHSRRLHLSLKTTIDLCPNVKVFTVGGRMAALYEELSPAQQGARQETPEAIEKQLLTEIRPGDVVMVKGSNGSRTWALAAALRRHFADGSST